MFEHHYTSKILGYKSLVVFSIILFPYISFGQNFKPDKNNFYIYWGWNVSGYSKSDINFKADNYNFTLFDVRASDRPTKFSFKEYFAPHRFTVPQYNFRLAYFFNEDWSISFGIDHMKYVAIQDQSLTIEGTISDTQTPYDGQYDEAEILLHEDFLQYEHTDGLNYGQFTLQHHSSLIDRKIIQLSWLQGLGIGTYTPRSEIRLLNYEESDLFHLAGFGFDGMLGLQLSIFNTFFIQSEFKAGYVNLPRIIIGPDGQRAQQDFFFLQQNVVFGSHFRFKKKSTATIGQAIY